MAFAAFDPLGGVIAHPAAVAIGLYALTVENRRRWAAALAVGFADEGAQRVIEGHPLVIDRPLTEDMVDRLPRGKVGGQIPSRKPHLTT
jgi:hypothetical protein